MKLCLLLIDTIRNCTNYKNSYQLGHKRIYEEELQTSTLKKYGFCPVKKYKAPLEIIKENKAPGKNGIIPKRRLLRSNKKNFVSLATNTCSYI